MARLTLFFHQSGFLCFGAVLRGAKTFDSITVFSFNCSHITSVSPCVDQSMVLAASISLGQFMDLKFLRSFGWFSPGVVSSEITNTPWSLLPIGVAKRRLLIRLRDLLMTRSSKDAFWPNLQRVSSLTCWMRARSWRKAIKLSPKEFRGADSISQLISGALKSPTISMFDNNGPFEWGNWWAACFQCLVLWAFGICRFGD